MTKRNDGIIVTGGSFTVGGSAVVGAGARAHTTVNQPTFPAGLAADPEISQRLMVLEDALHSHAGELADHQAAIGRLNELVEELSRPEPRASRVTEILSALRDGAGSVAAVLGSVASIEHVLTLLL